MTLVLAVFPGNGRRGAGITFFHGRDSSGEAKRLGFPRCVSGGIEHGMRVPNALKSFHKRPQSVYQSNILFSVREEQKIHVSVNVIFGQKGGVVTEGEGRWGGMLEVRDRSHYCRFPRLFTNQSPLRMEVHSNTLTKCTKLLND